MLSDAYARHENFFHQRVICAPANLNHLRKVIIINEFTQIHRISKKKYNRKIYIVRESRIVYISHNNSYFGTNLLQKELLYLQINT